MKTQEIAVEPELADFQTWMQTFIVEPGSSEEAIQAAEERAGLASGSVERLVKRSPTLDELERLEIYRGMYLLRMEEALSIDFPATKSLLGKRAFFELVEDYVKVHPSRSWTLDHLGVHLEHFVREHPLAKSFPVLADLISLEQRLCEVFNAPEQPVLEPDGVAALAPEQWPTLQLEPVAAFRLAKLDSNANDYYRAYNADQDWPIFEEGEHFVVVWRSDYELWRMPLGKPAFEMLSSLADRNPVGEALNCVLEQFEIEEHEVFEWFSSWVSEGFFAELS